MWSVFCLPVVVPGHAPVLCADSVDGNEFRPLPLVSCVGSVGVNLSLTVIYEVLCLTFDIVRTLPVLDGYLSTRDVKTGKIYYCGAERLSQLYPIMSTKKYKPAMKAELMEGEIRGLVECNVRCPFCAHTPKRLAAKADVCGLL